MATRKQPVKRAVKQEEPKQIEEEITQIEVKEELKEERETSIKIKPDLYDKMMKIGGQAYWQHVLENYYNELAKRYRS